MNDIQQARKLLEEGHSLAIVNDGVCIYTGKGSWIHPIVEAYEVLGDALHGAAVADRIIGKAAAILCIRGRVGQVYTPIASRAAVEAFTRAGIPMTCDTQVEGIMSRSGTGLCLAEKALMDLEELDEAFYALWKLLGKSLPADKGKGSTA